MYKNLIKIAIIISLSSLSLSASSVSKSVNKTPNWLIDPKQNNLIYFIGSDNNYKSAYLNALCQIPDFFQVKITTNKDNSIMKTSSSIRIGATTTLKRFSIKKGQSNSSECSVITRHNGKKLSALFKTTDNSAYIELPSNFDDFTMALANDGLFLINKYSDKKQAYVQIAFSQNISKIKKNSDATHLWNKFKNKSDTSALWKQFQKKTSK